MLVETLNTVIRHESDCQPDLKLSRTSKAEKYEGKYECSPTGEDKLKSHILHLLEILVFSSLRKNDIGN